MLLALASAMAGGTALAAADAAATPDAAAGPPRQEEKANPSDRSPRFLVRGVAPSDALNVRSGASPRSPVVGTIPPDAGDVRATGRRLKRGSSLWWEVSYGGVRGWVNSRFLTRQKEPPPAPPSPAAPGDLFSESLTCYLTEPFWRIDIHKDGRAACTETCDGPEGLRATPPHAVKGKPQSWSVEVRDVEGAPFMTLSLRRTGRCREDLSDDRYAYEIAARRPRGPAYKGCCNSLGPRKK